MEQEKSEQEKKPDELNYYKGLCKYTEDFFKQCEKEKHTIKMSEIVGGLEMMKQQFYVSQTWFVEKTAHAALVKEMKIVSSKIVKGLTKNGTKADITLSSDGSVIVRKDA